MPASPGWTWALTVPPGLSNITICSNQFPQVMTLLPERVGLHAVRVRMQDVFPVPVLGVRPVLQDVLDVVVVDVDLGRSQLHGRSQPHRAP